MPPPPFLRLLLIVMLAWPCLRLAAEETASAPPDAVTPDGGRYYGALVDGRLEGQGRLEWDNGNRYEGGFAQGLYSGHGRMQTADGTVYEGEFVQGRPEGQGTLHAKEFDYSGQFAQGEFSGQGELRSRDGRKASGQFASNRLNGQGRMEYPDGAVYEGEFKDGEPAGQGRLRTANHGLMEGRFGPNGVEGPGVLTLANGDRYEGQMKAGQLDGEGRFTGRDARHYTGGFKDNLFSGQGELTLPNGDRYVGGFRFGVYQGQGTLTHAHPGPDQAAVESGEWRYGHLDDSPTDRARKARAEAALYAQSNLLASQFQGLRPRRPGHPNLFLLAVAGSSSQEVFRREVDLVSAQFAQRFDTAGHTVVLGNSASTLDSRPLATLTSLRYSLQRLGELMDVKQDVLFLFLTSHGSHDHHFVLQPPGIDIPDLSPEQLAEALHASGIQWRVLVVSACYSGGFIDALRDDHTLIITAARADRTSFGCSDDQELTEFGRAYFADALPASGSFEEAFHRAEVLISAREDARAAEEESAGNATDGTAATNGDDDADADDAEAAEAAEAAGGDAAPAASMEGAASAGASEGAPAVGMTDPAAIATARNAERREKQRSYPQISAPEAIRQHLAQWWSQWPPAPAGAPVASSGASSR